MSLSKEVRELLTDPEAIWQALSIDGVSYPFDSTLHGMNSEQRKKIAEKIKIFDDETALYIANLILAYQSAIDTGLLSDAISADELIGQIVRKQIIKHLESIAESRA